MGIIAQGPTATITDETMQGADGRGYLRGLPLLWEQLTLMVEGYARRESATFHNNAHGTKAFATTPNGVQWPANLRLQVIDENEAGQSLFGHVIGHDTEAGTVTVEITASTGEGPWSSARWVLFVTGWVEREDLPPNDVSFGFTGGTTPAGARQSLECLRHLELAGIRTDPPVGIPAGLRYLLLNPKTLSEEPCSGAWTGHRGRFAISDGEDGWVLEDAIPYAGGTLSVYDNATGTLAVWASGDWLPLRRNWPRVQVLGGINAEERYTVDPRLLDTGQAMVFFEFLDGQSPAVVLPPAQAGARLTLKLESGPDVEIEVDGVSLGSLRTSGPRSVVLVTLGGGSWRVAHGELAS